MFTAWAGNVFLSSPTLSASDQNALPTDSFTDSVSKEVVASLAWRQVLVS